jgi:hypothetical protein
MEDEIKEIFDRVGMKYLIPTASEKRKKLDSDNSKRLEELIDLNVGKISELIKQSDRSFVNYTFADEFVDKYSMCVLLVGYLKDIGYSVSVSEGAVSVKVIGYIQNVTLEISW